MSTGSLPADDRLVDAIERVLLTVRSDRRGAVSTVYPALAAADPDLFGLALVGVSGRVVSAGDDSVEFTIMSVAKPFVLALVGDAIGPERVRMRVGVNATGLAFNSAEAVERMPGGRTNPSPGKGALATYSPPLDDAGNSVRGQIASMLLSRELGLDVFATTST